MSALPFSGMKASELARMLRQALRVQERPPARNLYELVAGMGEVRGPRGGVRVRGGIRPDPGGDLAILDDGRQPGAYGNIVNPHSPHSPHSAHIAATEQGYFHPGDPEFEDFDAFAEALRYRGRETYPTDVADELAEAQRLIDSMTEAGVDVGLRGEPLRQNFRDLGALQAMLAALGGGGVMGALNRERGA
jgi:hypothetical protein